MIMTGPDWKACSGPITADSMYAGEDYDCRRDPGDWTSTDFDDSEEARFCWPPLTTARQPTPAMAEAAIAAVLRGGAEPAHLVFDMPLVVRRSCGCPTG
jgi:DNA-binding LacI/PurR family transcriptional regulator